MAWRLARSLDTLRAEVNGFAPNRSKASDGTLGDPAHASRPSRHNPNRYGVVTALDLTHDPAGGCDIHAIARRLVKTPHPELAYIISNAEVAKRTTGFRWEPYTGANEHRKHAHFAVGVGPDSDPLPPYDSLLSWGVSLPAPIPVPLEDDMAAPIFYDDAGTDHPGTYVLFPGVGKVIQLRNTTDAAELKKAAKDPGYTAKLSEKGADEIRKVFITS